MELWRKVTSIMVPLEVVAVSRRLFTHSTSLPEALCFSISTTSTFQKDQEPFYCNFYEISTAYSATALLAKADLTDPIQHF